MLDFLDDVYESVSTMLDSGDATSLADAAEGGVEAVTENAGEGVGTIAEAATDGAEEVVRQSADPTQYLDSSTFTPDTLQYPDTYVGTVGNIGGLENAGNPNSITDSTGSWLNRNLGISGRDALRGVAAGAQRALSPSATPSSSGGGGGGNSTFLNQVRELPTNTSPPPTINFQMPQLPDPAASIDKWMQRMGAYSAGKF